MTKTILSEKASEELYLHLLVPRLGVTGGFAGLLWDIIEPPDFSMTPRPGRMEGTLSLITLARPH